MQVLFWQGKGEFLNKMAVLISEKRLSVKSNLPIWKGKYVETNYVGNEQGQKVYQTNLCNGSSGYKEILSSENSTSPTEAVKTHRRFCRGLDDEFR